MIKLFIGLLIVAAGTGVFFLLRNKNETETTNGIKKELIVGNWKVDSIYIRPEDSVNQFNLALIATIDSNYKKLQHQFHKNGIVTTYTEKNKTDTSYYQWNEKNDLIFKSRSDDSTGKIYTVVQLTIDSIRLQSNDSVTFLLIKAK